MPHRQLSQTAQASGAPARELLRWYDRHRRDLPWRAAAGATADPYRVWLSEIMLQQTTVAAVKPYFARFLARFPTVRELAAAPSEAVMQSWAGLGYYSRARHLHACAKEVVASHGGAFPSEESALRALPGVGPYTAAAIAAIAFGRVAAAVDGNVERVITRLARIETPLPAAKAVIRERTLALVPQDRPGDFAQAMMDLGATICTPRNPACALCPWLARCGAAARGDQMEFPRKAPKAARPQRYGAAYVALREDGAVLLHTRPPKGLLGGMAQPPVGPWLAEPVAMSLTHAPLSAPWRGANAPVRHVFTHFPLEMKVYAARVPATQPPPEGMRFTPLAQLGQEPLPNVMVKALRVGLAALGEILPEFEGLNP